MKNKWRRGCRRTVLSALVHIVGVSFCQRMTLSALAVISFVYLVSLDIQVCLIFFIILIIKTAFLLTHQFILFSFLHITEQGRRHDLKKINSRIMKTSDDTCIVPPPLDVSSDSVHYTCIVPPPLDVSSDSVHCNALTQSRAVSYAFSCHTTDSCFEDNADVDSTLALPSSSTKVKEDIKSSTALIQGTPLPQPQPPLWVNPSWVHVFSKSCSTTSLRTQSAAVAYLDLKSPKVLHRRARRAKKRT